MFISFIWINIAVIDIIILKTGVLKLMNIGSHRDKNILNEISILFVNKLEYIEN